MRRVHLGSLIACSISQELFIPIVRRRITSAHTSHVSGLHASLLAPPSPSAQPQVVDNGACDTLAFFLGEQSTHAAYASLHQPEHDVEPEIVVLGPAARHAARVNITRTRVNWWLASTPQGHVAVPVSCSVEFRRVVSAGCARAAIRESGRELWHEQPTMFPTEPNR